MQDRIPDAGVPDMAPDDPMSEFYYSGKNVDIGGATAYDHLEGEREASAPGSDLVITQDSIDFTNTAEEQKEWERKASGAGQKGPSDPEQATPVGIQTDLREHLAFGLKDAATAAGMAAVQLGAGGTEAGQGMRVSKETSEFALAAVDMARGSLARGAVNNLAYDRAFMEAFNAAKAAGVFGDPESEAVKGLMPTRANLRFITDSCTSYLAANNSVYLRDGGIRGRGTTTRSRAALSRMSYGIADTDRAAADVLRKLGHVRQMDDYRRGRLVRFGKSKYMRSLRDTDSGEGLNFLHMLVKRSTQTLKLGLVSVHNIRRAGGVIAKRGYIAVLKGAAKKLAENPESGTARMVREKASEKLLKKQRKAEKRRGRRVRHERVLGRIRDPFGLKRKAAVRWKASKLGRAVGRAFRPVDIVRSVVSKAIAAVMAAVGTLLSLLFAAVLFLLVIGFVLMVLLSIVSTVVSLFDFGATEDEIREAALDKIASCYSSQNQAIENMRANYTYTYITYEDERDEGAYEEAELEAGFTETTNSAEILSMAQVYFDFDLESAGKEAVLEYIEKLYNGSHMTTTKVVSEDWVDEDGESHTETTAYITLTTNYFNSLFDCELLDSYDTLSGDTNMEMIWNYLVSHGLTEQGAAIVMGCWACESGFEPNRLQGTVSNSQESVSYTAKVDSGEISKTDFCNNGPNGGGYGLAQWTSPGRKAKLYDSTVGAGLSIGDLQGQLDFFLSEVKESYPSAWSIVCSASSCDDETVAKFEKIYEGSAAGLQNRGKKARKIYAMYQGTTADDDTSSVRSAILLAAKSKLGCKYVHGATGPDEFDCSGLTQWCYKKAGISIPRTSHAQGKGGKVVSEPKPGDIVYFEKGHVGIYVGNGQMIHASDPSKGVIQTACTYSGTPIYVRYY